MVRYKVQKNIDEHCSKEFHQDEYLAMVDVSKSEDTDNSGNISSSLQESFISSEKHVTFNEPSVAGYLFSEDIYTLWIGSKNLKGNFTVSIH